MNILALDPATECGWAHSRGQSGTWSLRVRSDESDGMRLVRLQAKLDEIKHALGVDLLVFEAARAMRFGNATRVAGEIGGAVKLWATHNGINYRGYSPSEIKRHATGKGNADKLAMFEAARVKWPRVAGEDEADALWLLDLATNEYGERAPSRAKE